MAHKLGLNKKEQLQATKWLAEGISPAEIAKKFHTDVAIIKEFTPEKVAAAAEFAAKYRGEKIAKPKKEGEFV